MLPSPPHLKPDYGIDAPVLLRILSWSSLTLLAIAALTCLFRNAIYPLFHVLFHVTFWPGLACLIFSLGMLYFNNIGKLRFRDRLIAVLDLQGHERVLDIGCGHGLLLLGMAKKLTTGRAVGIDNWPSIDLNGNAITTTEENARRENVADRVELHSGPLDQLPFPDHHFDLVVSHRALHQLPDTSTRRQALQEILRVVKPGGQIALVDSHHTREYFSELQEWGVRQLSRKGPYHLFGIPSYTIWGTNTKDSLV